MNPVAQLLAPISLASLDMSALAVLLVFVPLFVLFTVRAKSGRRFTLRPIAAYDQLRRLVSQAIESGRPIHVGLGAGHAGTEETAESAAGLVVFDYVARHAAASSQGVLGTVGDGATLGACQGLLRAARGEAGFAESYRPTEVVFGGPDPFAYAVSAARAVKSAEHTASVLIGRFGSEALWLGGALSASRIPQVGAATDPVTASLVVGGLDYALVGEEMFAAGAYLHRPSHLGSLATQDVVRVVAIAAIVAGVLLTSLGLWG